MAKNVVNSKHSEVNQSQSFSDKNKSVSFSHNNTY